MRKALIEGVVVNLIDDGDEVWEHLRKEGPPIVCVGCGGRAHTRETTYDSLTVRMFVHNAGYGERCRLLGDVGEGPKHELLKEQIVRAARSGGWSADVEVISPDEKVRADVVCTNGDRTHTWEAQLATLNRHLANERHERYVHTWGNTTWVHTGYREWSKDIPSIRVDEEQRDTVIGGVYVNAEEPVPPAPLSGYVPRILDRIQIVYVTDPFGYYQDSSIPSKPKQRRQRQASGREGIAYSTTDCPTEQVDVTETLSLFGDVVSEAVRVQKTITDDQWWSQRARRAAARQLDGIALDEIDRESLRRAWEKRR